MKGGGQNIPAQGVEMLKNPDHPVHHFLSSEIVWCHGTGREREGEGKGEVLEMGSIDTHKWTGERKSWRLRKRRRYFCLAGGR